MSHIVKALLVVQVSMIICLCIGLSPLFAGAQDKKSKHSKTWQMYVDCKPDLTPAQNKEFESKSWDDRKLFLAIHCKHVLPPEPAQPVKKKPVTVATGQGEQKIAVFQIVDEAGMDPRDVSTLDTIVERAVKEEAHGRYGIVVMEPAQEGEYCDDSCMLEKAGAKGASFAILGKLSSFGSGQVLSLELLKTDGAEVVASTVTDAVALEKLPGETRAAAEQLIARSPFKKPVTKVVAPAGFVAARPDKPTRRISPYSYGYYPEPNWRSGSEPPSYKGPRIVAHIFFWLGLDFGGGAAILLEAGLFEEGVVFIAIGSTLVILATICAGSYSKKRREREEWDRKYGGSMYGGPIVTPDFAGLGLVKSF